MAAKLENFMIGAIQAAFDDLDVYCRASLKSSKDQFMLSDKLPKEDIRSGERGCILLELGDGQVGALVLSTAAFICLAGSMMLLPKERVREMMAEAEIDEETELTIHEVSNLVAGSIGRYARENSLYGHDIRLIEVLVKAADRVDEFPFLEGASFAYRFILKTDRSEPFHGALCLPEPVIQSDFKGDALIQTLQAQAAKAEASSAPARVEAGVSAPAATPANNGYPPANGGGSQGWNGGPPPGWNGGPPQGWQGGPPQGWNGGPQQGWQGGPPPGPNSGPPQGWNGGPQGGGWNTHSPTSFHEGWGGAGGGTRGHVPMGGGFQPWPVPGAGGGEPTTTYRAAMRNALAEPTQISRADINLQGLRVLIVDDSWVARRALASQLIPYGCIVSDAKDAATASQLMSRREFDVLLLDVMLPGESGLAYCARLRAEGLTEKIAVIMVSGVSTSDNVVKSINAGASFFLVKPVSEMYLLRVLNGVVRQYRGQGMRLASGS